MTNGNITFYKNATETIRKKVKKSNFFGIFQIFFGSDGQLLDNFGQLLDNFIGTFHYKNDPNKIFVDYIR